MKFFSEPWIAYLNNEPLYRNWPVLRQKNLQLTYYENNYFLWAGSAFTLSDSFWGEDSLMAEIRWNRCRELLIFSKTEIECRPQKDQAWPCGPLAFVFACLECASIQGYVSQHSMPDLHDKEGNYITWQKKTIMNIVSVLMADRAVNQFKDCWVSFWKACNYIFLI